VKKELDVHKVSTDDNLADILTKPIGAEIFNKHLKTMRFAYPKDNGETVLSMRKIFTDGSSSAMTSMAPSAIPRPRVVLRCAPWACSVVGVACA